MRPNRRTFAALARIDALDCFIDYGLDRWHELLAHIRELHGRAVTIDDSQLAFDVEVQTPALPGVISPDLLAAPRPTWNCATSTWP